MRAFLNNKITLITLTVIAIAVFSEKYTHGSLSTWIKNKIPISQAVFDDFDDTDTSSGEGVIVMPDGSVKTFSSKKITTDPNNSENLLDQQGWIKITDMPAMPIKKPKKPCQKTSIRSCPK